MPLLRIYSYSSDAITMAIVLVYLVWLRQALKTKGP